MAGELARVLGGYTSALIRYQPDGASSYSRPATSPRNARCRSVSAFRSRVKASRRWCFAPAAPPGWSYENAPGSAAVHVRELGLRSGVGAPIVVDGRLWGVAIVVSSRPAPLPPDTEARVADFADLVATTIANAEARANSPRHGRGSSRPPMAPDAVSNAICTTAPNSGSSRWGYNSVRRRLRCPPSCTQLKDADIRYRQRSCRRLGGSARDLPGASSGDPVEGGLGPALKTLARRSAVPVVIDLGFDRRLPESAEVAAYYVVAEALTNAAKHAPRLAG